jgi:hypothetical protein
MSDGGKVTTTLTVNPYDPVLSIAMASSSVTAGAEASCTVSLEHPAPVGGATVAMASSNAAVLVSGSVNFAAGVQSVKVYLNTYSVVSEVAATVSASADGVTKTATLTVKPAVFSVSLVPSSLVGGLNSDAVVRLASKAAAAETATIAASNALATVPASYPIVDGSAAFSFPFKTSPVSATTLVAIKVTIGGVTQPALLTLTPPAITSLTITTNPVIGGKPSEGIVRLAGYAGASGDVVKISSNNAAVIVPATITVPSGSYAVSFPITTKAVAAAVTAAITITFGSSSKTATLTVSS